MPRPSEEDARIERFNWWWRRVFWRPETNKLIPKRRKKRMASIAPPEIDSSDEEMIAGLEWAIQRITAEPDWLRAFWATHERSAFLYEGVKRRTGRYEFGVDWLKLTVNQQNLLRQRWPEPDVEKIVEIQICPDDGSEPGWSNLIRHRWNLKCSDDAIDAKFNRVIVQQRNHFNIAPARIARTPMSEWLATDDAPILPTGWTRWFLTRWNLNSNFQSLLDDFRVRIDEERVQFPNPRPNAKRRNRGRSWMGIEALDLAAAGESLDDKHRWAKRKAEREIERALNGPS